MTESSAKKLFRRPDWLAAILITGAIVWLHFFLLFHAGGFWRDEVNSINVASHHSLNEMARDSFPVLMPLLIHGWLALGLGHADIGLRLLGFLIGLGVPAVLWLAAWRIKHAPPLVGLGLFGMNSTLIVFGDSIRAYGLGTLLMTMTVGAAAWYLMQPSWKRAGWLTLLAVLSVQALYHNAILVAAICIGGWAVCWRRKNLRAALQLFLAGLLAAISLLPYLPMLLAGQESAAVIRTGLQSWRFFSAFQDSLGFPLGEYIYVWGALALILIFCAGAAIQRAIKKITPPDRDAGADDLGLFAGTTLLVAVVGFIVFLWLAAFPSQSWYLLPLIALAAMCFEIGLPPVRGKLRALSFGLVTATALIAIPTASRDLQCRFTNIDTWAAELTPAASADDYIVVVPWFCGITFDHYFKGSAAWATLPPLADHSTHRYDLVRTQLQDTNVIKPVLQRILTTLHSSHRVWILAGMGWMDVPEPGTSAPASLPPAPLKNSGWSETPYTMLWASQVAHLVGDHSLQFGRVKNPATGRLIIENTELFVAEGWKEFSATNSAQPPKPRMP